MKQELNFQVRAEQSLILTASMQQSLHLLQLPQLELEAYLEKEVAKNPLLSLRDRPQSGTVPLEYSMNSVADRPSLYRHLISQAGEFLRGNELLVEEILGSLDKRGFLGDSTAEIACRCNATEAMVLRAIETIQTFDPPGIAARNTAESLRIQLRRLGKKDTLAYRILETNYDDLLHGRIKALSRTFHVTPNVIIEAIEKDIVPLNPCPGKKFDTLSIAPTTPDIIIDEALHFQLGDKSHTLVEFVPEYAKLITEATLSKEERRTLTEYIKSGKWLIKSLTKRKGILRELASFLCSAQLKFLLGEQAAVNPMTISEVANELGYHESTLARAVQHKTILCPAGCFPIRKLFTQKIQTTRGDHISNDMAKVLLLQLVKEENKRAPLSDENLSEKLKEKGISLARRTIAKYRHELNILSAQRRKKLQ